MAAVQFASSLLLLCLLVLSLLNGCFAAVNTPGHCEVVKPALTQQPDTSSTCAELASFQAANPNSSWSDNPYSDIAYRGSPGYFVGTTARNETACCQGPPPRPPCAGACPCGVTNVLHCGRRDSSGVCVDVQQCEIPPEYRWVSESGVAQTWKMVAIIAPVSVALVAVVVLLIWWRRRVASNSIATPVMQPAGAVQADEGAYSRL